jgi:hypothetical protein
MISKIRRLQFANPEFGFTCAVDVPESGGKVAGFLTLIQTSDKKVWQTHHLEEFKSMTQAARYLVEEYQRMRSHPHAHHLIPLDAILWFYRIAKDPHFDVNQLSESELVLATTILDQKQYFVLPEIRHSYWLPTNSNTYKMRFWDIANPWVKPMYSTIYAPDLVVAHAKEKLLVETLLALYRYAVDYICYL